MKRIPKGVWVLGFVSMLMDISSEMIHSLLPLFMATSLGMGGLAVGLIEGVAESTALIVKVFSGALSDFIGKRKGLAALGYGLGALSKPLFALATSPWMTFTARFVDRIGKGIRGAPRDALIAGITPAELRGASFGLRQSLDTMGAFAGPLLAFLFMFLLSGNFRTVFWIAVIPGFLAVLLIMAGIKEPTTTAVEKRTNPITKTNLKQMGKAYWGIVIIGFFFSLTRFSEAFLVLQAHNSGIPLALVPLAMVVMNLIYSIAAYPFGKLSDKVNNRKMLAAGAAVLFLANIILAMATNWFIMLLGIGLWGIHLGMTQGLLSAMVAGAAPKNLSGTAFGFFNLASGIAILIASISAGFLWEFVSAASTFMFGATLCLITLILLMVKK